MARRATKCFIDSRRRAGQDSSWQRGTTSPSSLTTGPSQAGAGLWQGHAALLSATVFRQHLHDVGNNVAGSFDHHRVAYHHIKPRDFIPVVQAGARYRYATDFYRFQVGYRGYGAGAPDLQDDILHHRDRLARGEFACNGPAGGAGFLAQFALQGPARPP